MITSLNIRCIFADLNGFTHLIFLGGTVQKACAIQLAMISNVRNHIFYYRMLPLTTIAPSHQEMACPQEIFFPFSSSHLPSNSFTSSLQTPPILGESELPPKISSSPSKISLAAPKGSRIRSVFFFCCHHFSGANSPFDSITEG